MVDKSTVTTLIADLEDQLRKNKRLLEKLENANTQLTSEPEPGTVLRFERPIAGGSTKYTFVLLAVGKDSWTVTGKKNALNGIGLKETGNTWQDVTVAVGQNTLYRVTDWEVAKEPIWHYFQGNKSDRVYRAEEAVTTTRDRSTKIYRYEPVLQEWVQVQVDIPNLRYIPASIASLLVGPRAISQ